MLIGNSITSIDSANANRNLPVLDAQTGNRKTNNEDRTQPTSAAAADKVSLSDEAKAISKSKEVSPPVTTPGAKPESDAIQASRESQGTPTDITAIKKELKTFIDDLEKSKISDRELTQTLKKTTADVESRAEKAINHAVQQLRAGTIDEKKFARKLDKIASEQANGLLSAMKDVQDQDSKQTQNTAPENKAPENKAPKSKAPEPTAVKVAAAKMAAAGIAKPEEEEEDPPL